MAEGAVLTEKDDGARVMLPVGSMITVRLHEASTSGYQWVIDDDGGGVLAVSSEQFRPGTATGGQAEHEFQFVAVGQGTAPLSLVHRRSWSPDDPGGRRWDVTIEVVVGDNRPIITRSP